MKVLTTTIIIAIAAGSCLGSTSLSWVSEYGAGQGSLPDLYSPDGSVITQTSDWYVQLFDVSESWDFSGDRTAGELYNSNTPVKYYDGLLFVNISEIYPWASGKTVGTRMYNNSNPNDAALFAESTLPTTIQTLSGEGTDPSNIIYNAGEIRQEDWVPEPMTTMLALVGVGTVIYRRRRMRNK